jgi:hypothetical protein
MVDGSGDSPSSSLSFGEVDHDELLHLKRRPAMMYFGHLGFGGCSLTGELVLLLGAPAINVNMPSAGSHSLLLLIGLLLLGEEPSTWLWCGGPQWDC